MIAHDAGIRRIGRSVYGVATRCQSLTIARVTIAQHSARPMPSGIQWRIATMYEWTDYILLANGKRLIIKEGK